MSNLFNELLESKRAIKARLNEVGDYWNFDNLGLDDYDKYFRPYVGCSIQELRDSALKANGHVKAVNIMGGTRVLGELGADESYAVRLRDDRDELTKKEDGQKRVFLIEGNILSKKTIDKIPGDIDILLCMPAGAWEFLPYNRDFYHYLGNVAVKKMAVGGIALIQLPMLADIWMRDYIGKIKNTPGITFNYFGKDSSGIQSVLIIRKTEPNVELPI